MNSLSIPADMQAVEIPAPGPPEVLRLTRRPTPRPGPGEVLIRVAAAGVNRPDCVQRQGQYPPPPGASDLPGLEVSGVVVATAGDVTTPAVGTAVCALLAGGGYAEYAAVPAVQCLPVPAGLSHEEAAAIPETFFTVWTNVYERGRLAPGETLLVHGGASGIGTTAIQLGKALGARVFATAGTDEKCRLCEALGAERAFNYRTEKFAEALRAHLGGAIERGGSVDVILDMVGGPYLPDNLRLLREDGRLLYIAALAGAKGEANIAQIFVKRLTVTGSTLRNRSPAEKGRIAQALQAQVWPLLAKRVVVPQVDQVLPLAEAAVAHRLMEENRILGKIVLKVADLP